MILDAFNEIQMDGQMDHMDLGLLDSFQGLDDFLGLKSEAQNVGADLQNCGFSKEPDSAPMDAALRSPQSSSGTSAQISLPGVSSCSNIAALRRSSLSPRSSDDNNDLGDGNLQQLRSHISRPTATPKSKDRKRGRFQAPSNNAMTVQPKVEPMCYDDDDDDDLMLGCKGGGGNVSHSTVEKRRRDRINTLIDLLAEQVPPLSAKYRHSNSAGEATLTALVPGYAIVNNHKPISK